MFIPLSNRVVYALVDPREGVVRYVGVAGNPEYRLKEHIREAKRLEEKVKNGYKLYSRKHKKDLWLLEMMQVNINPVLVLLDSVLKEESQKAEQFWIDHFYKFGFLLNDKIQKK